MWKFRSCDRDRRPVWAIYYDILKDLSVGETYLTSQLHYFSKIDYRNFQCHLWSLWERGLVDYAFRHGQHLFWITEKGRVFVKKYHALSQILVKNPHLLVL